MLAIKAKKRDAKENLTDLRKAGELPAVFYGLKQDTTSVSVNLIEFQKIWREAGESSAVKIKTEGGDIDVLIQEVQADPITNLPIHVDFLAIDMKKKIQVAIQIEFVGISGAVKNGIGTLVKVLHEVEVEALPNELPHSLEVDITALENVKDQILAGDIKLPANVILITNKEDVVVLVAEQKEEKEEEVPVDLSAIEVEKKGKQEEEGAAPEAPATPE
ncbi:MAG TPA: 50S ribosomal protein L25 [Candidatus Paceibacterota bacterium]|nr:50S ribosomal protein L25 [Candidatus Paceibacterota bacterium]